MEYQRERADLFRPILTDLYVDREKETLVIVRIGRVGSFLYA